MLFSLWFSDEYLAYIAAFISPPVSYRMLLQGVDNIVSQPRWMTIGFDIIRLGASERVAEVSQMGLLDRTLRFAKAVIIDIYLSSEDYLFKILLSALPIPVSPSYPSHQKEGSTMAQTFGEVLKARRKVRGITIVELAEQTGLSQADLVGAELGLKGLAPSQRQRIEAFIRRQRII